MAYPKIIRKVKTGIPGMDELLSGGFPEGYFILLAGSCGTGKSIFSLQFLYNGALQLNEPGVYVTLEESVDEMVKTGSVFGWDVEEMIRKNKLAIIETNNNYNFKKLRATISNAVKKIGAKRAVVDSFSILSMYFKEPLELRKGLSELRHDIKKLGCTTLAVSDIKEKSTTYSVSGFEEFIADGVVVLKIISKETGGSHVRAVFVRKMRTIQHSLDLFPIAFEKNGLRVFPDARIFEQEYSL